MIGRAASGLVPVNGERRIVQFPNAGANLTLRGKWPFSVETCLLSVVAEANPFLWFPISLGVVAFATVVVVVYLIRTYRSRLIWGALAVAIAVVVGLFVFAWYWAQRYLG